MFSSLFTVDIDVLITVYCWHRCIHHCLLFTSMYYHCLLLTSMYYNCLLLTSMYSLLFTIYIDVFITAYYLHRCIITVYCWHRCFITVYYYHQCNITVYYLHRCTHHCLLLTSMFSSLFTIDIDVFIIN